MARCHTSEETCVAFMNDEDFEEIESTDSLDDSFSDTSSMSEIDSNLENDFSERNITVKTPSQRGKTSYKGHEPTIEAAYFSYYWWEPIIWYDQSSDSEQEEDCYICSGWKEDAPKLKIFPFNERPGMKINVPENGDPVFFFELMLTEDLVEDLVKKNEWVCRRNH